MSNEATEALLQLGRDLLAEVRGLREDMRGQRTAAPAASPRTEASPGVPCFPNYGKSKGQPIAGATMGDLEYYAAGCRRSLADPAKARWHGKERETLAVIEAEIARQSGGGGSASAAPPSDEFGPGDDDIPF